LQSTDNALVDNHFGEEPPPRSGLAIPPDAVERVGWALRLALLVLVALLVIATTHDLRSLIWVLLLAVAALPAWTPPYHTMLAPLGRLAEVCVTALGASTLAAVHGGSTASALLPYLTVPVVMPALEGRLRESMYLLGVAAAILTVAGAADGLFTPDELGYPLSVLEWLVIAGLSAGFVQSVQRRFMLNPPDPGPQPYAEATRLLTQLRTVARRLPGATLDPGGIAEHLIEEVRAVAAVDRAAVLTGSGGGRLVVLAQSALERVDWETSLDADSAVAEAWASQQAQVTPRSQTRTSGSGKDVTSLVLPLVSGVRTVGLIVLETDRTAAFPPHTVARINALAAPAALRLEAALLFDDVRSLATNEERQRLAREIHDGVAQELVMVGYGIDNALASLPDQALETAEELRLLRAEVTRVITELRLSLFELRSEVDRQGGLTAAVSEYARTVGAAGGLRVHFSVEETPARLPASIEAELMRIAQEAITNARKHAGAQNLWVSCEIDPPYARIEVSDDGAGIGPHRPEGRFGLAIMAERAERIRGQLEITPRASGGTSVAVVLGAPPGRSTL
jgi:signal transduction histidine kinase